MMIYEEKFISDGIESGERIWKRDKKRKKSILNGIESFGSGWKRITSEYSWVKKGTSLEIR